MGKIITITSANGGAGKSLFTARLGAALSAKGKSVLMIDCDAFMRSLDYYSGVSENLVFDISDVFTGKCQPIKAIYQCPVQGKLFILPAPAGGEKSISFNRLKQLVSGLARYYSYILVDAPLGMGENFGAVTQISDEVIVIAAADKFSVKSSDILRTRLEEFGAKKIRIVINKYEKAILQEGLIDDLDFVIDESRIQLLGVIGHSFTIAKAAADGKLLTDKSPASQAVERIADRIEGIQTPVIL